jgi:hypothetical protein
MVSSFHPSLEEAEIDGYTWHCNRHTFGSWLAMAGASIKEIQEARSWRVEDNSNGRSIRSPIPRTHRLRGRPDHICGQLDTRLIFVGDQPPTPDNVENPRGILSEPTFSRPARDPSRPT